jgi:hypothetical protein
LSHHAGNPTAYEGSRIDLNQYRYRWTGSNLRSEIRRHWQARLGSRVLAGYKEYRGNHPKPFFSIFVSRGYLQSTKEKQRYRSRSNGVVLKAISFSSGETRHAKNRVGERQSNHKSGEMGTAEHRDPGSKGRINRRPPGGPQGRCYYHGQSGISSLQAGETGRRTNQGDQQDLGCYSRGHLQNWVRQDNGGGLCLLALSFLYRPLQKIVYSINSRLGYYMSMNHQNLDFWILLCKDVCAKLKMKISIVDSNMYCKALAALPARL